MIRRLLLNSIRSGNAMRCAGTLAIALVVFLTGLVVGARPAHAAELVSVSFINDSSGWVSVSDGRIMTTKDGGISWTCVSNPWGYSTTVDFATAEYGWATDGTLLRETRDGGVTWTPVPLIGEGGPSQRISNLDCYSPSSGSMLQSGAVAYTADGGATWVRKALTSFEREGASDTGWVMDVVQSSETSLDVAGGGFVYRGGTQAAIDGLVWTTDDGLATYTLRNLESDVVSTWVHVDRVGDRVHLVSEDGYYGNLDASGLITPPASTGATWVVDAEFEANGTGWLAAREGIWHTADGGTTWRKVHGGYALDLSMVSDHSGYAITPTQVLKTEDGVTWQTLGLDVSGPTGTVSINNGAEFCNSRDVDISWDLYDPSGVQALRFAGSSLWTDWVPGSPVAHRLWSFGTLDGWQGDIAVHVQASDAQGNLSDFTDWIFLDPRLPVTTSDAKSSYDGRARVELGASDQGGSGIATTEWRLDDGTWAPGTIVTVAKPGNHSVEFRSTDLAGNVEGAKSASFRVWGTTTLSLATSSTAPTYDGSATLTSRLTNGPAGVGGKSVVFERWNGSAWTSIGVVSTDADGYASETLSGLKAKQQFRARFEESAPYRGAAAASISVTPKARLTRSTSWSTLYRYKTYNAKGYIEPYHATLSSNKVKIRAYKKGSDGKYHYMKSFTAGYSYHSKSKTPYSAKVVLNSKGSWKLVAYHATDSTNSSTYGSADYVTVK